jgi:hypothetical protein
MAIGKAPPHAWKPGQSGNPGGRPKAVRDLAVAARLHTADALATLAQIANDPKAPHHARVTACSELLDRGWGRAPQHIELGGELTVNGGIDAPVVPQTLEEWLARRHADLNAMGAAAWPSARRDPGETSH